MINHSNSRLLLAAAAAAAGLGSLACLPSPAWAVEKIWDIPPVPPNANTVSGGDGVWDTATPNWLNDDLATRTTWNNGSVDTAVFFRAEQNAQTVTVNQPIDAAGLTFEVGGYSFEGTGSLTLGALIHGVTGNDFAGPARIPANNLNVQVIAPGKVISVGTGTLSFGNTASAKANNLNGTVFNVKNGARLRANGGFTGGTNGVSAIAGANVNLAASTFVAGGKFDLAATNALDARLYLATGTGVAANLFPTLGRTPNKTRSLTQELSISDTALAAPDNIPNNHDAFWGGAAGSNQANGAFTEAFIGQFTAPASGQYEFRLSKHDDTGVVFFDADRDGQFELDGESAVGDGCCNKNPTYATGAGANLVAGQAYPIAFAVEDAGGGGYIQAQFRNVSDPASPFGAFTNVNPGAAAQAGLWQVGVRRNADFLTAGNQSNFTVQGTNASTIYVDAAIAQFNNLTFDSPTGQLTTSGIGSASFAQLTGADGPVILTVNTPTTVTGQVVNVADGTSDFAGLVKNGFATLTLNGDNGTMDATIRVQSGTVVAGSTTALGNLAKGTLVSAGGQLALRYAGTYGAEPVTLNGAGTDAATIVADDGTTSTTTNIPASNGALESAGADRAFGGPITVESNARIQTTSNILTLSGGINADVRTVTFGGGGTTLIAGPGISATQVDTAVRKVEGGTLRFGVAQPNLTGRVDIDAGTLQLENPNASSASVAVRLTSDTAVLNVSPGLAATATAPGTPGAAGANLANVVATNASGILRLSVDLGTGPVGTSPAAPFAGIVDVNADQGAGLAGFRLGNGGTLRVITADRTFASPISIDGTVNFGGNNGRLLNVAGAIGNNGAAVGNFVKPAGNDTVTLSATNTYTGTSTIGGGVVNANAASAFGAGTGAGGAVSVNGGTLNATVANALANKTVNVNGAIANLTPATSAGAATYNVAGTGLLRVAAAGAALGSSALNVGSGNVSGTPTLQFDAGGSNVASYGGTLVNLNAGVVQARSGIADLSNAVIVAQPLQPGTITNTLEQRLYRNFIGTDKLNPISTGNGLLAPGRTPTSTGTLAGPLSFNDGQLNAAAGQADTYSFAWTGRVIVSTAGTYSFGTRSDDGSVVYIDVNRNGTFDPATELVVNNNADQAPTDKTGQIALAAGSYPIAIGYYENGGGAEMVARVAAGAGVAYGSQAILNPASPIAGLAFSTGRETQGGGVIRVDAGSELRAKGYTGISEVALNGAAGNPARLVLANNATAVLSTSTAIGVTGLATFDTGSAGNTATVQNLNVAVGGTLTVSGSGRLAVNGAPAAGSTGTVVVSGGATLGGTGSIAGPVQIASGGRVAPGNSPGILTTGNLSLLNGSTTIMELNGPGAPGTNHDQLNVIGTVDIENAGSNLDVLLGYAPSVGDAFTIIENNDADAVTGKFFSANGQPIVADKFTLLGYAEFTINYNNGNNDVVLQVTAVPEPASLAVLAVGAVGLLARRRRRPS